MFRVKGLETFMSSRFEHGHATYNGYSYEHGHIIAEDGKKFYDFSITKNVAALLVVSTLLIIIFTSVARGYKKNQGRAPSGIQSFFEPVILYVRDGNHQAECRA